MPEGPEIKLMGDDLRELMKDHQLKQIYIPDGSPIFKKDPNCILYCEFINSNFIEITCKGKKIIMTFFHEKYKYWCICSSMGMEGKWSTQINNKHTHMALELMKGDKQLLIYFNDTRHFGDVTLCQNPDDINNYIKAVGPDFLNNNITWEQWCERMNSKKIGKWDLHKVLMEQSLVSGIGNYLKCDICYACQLRPDRLWDTLSNEDFLRIYEWSKYLSFKAFNDGGTTIRTYQRPNGETGKYQPLVYGRGTDDYGNQVYKIKHKDKRSSHVAMNYQF